MSTFDSNSVPPIIRNRKITGMSAVLLPFATDGSVDWPAFDRHVQRTLEAGLIPAVNMDTGYINLLDDATKLEVLQRTNRLTSGGMFVAGAFLADNPGSSFNLDEYSRRMNDIEQHTPPREPLTICRDYRLSWPCRYSSLFHRHVLQIGMSSTLFL